MPNRSARLGLHACAADRSQEAPLAGLQLAPAACRRRHRQLGRRVLGAPSLRISDAGYVSGFAGDLRPRGSGRLFVGANGVHAAMRSIRRRRAANWFHIPRLARAARLTSRLTLDRLPAPVLRRFRSRSLPPRPRPAPDRQRCSWAAPAAAGDGRVRAGRRLNPTAFGARPKVMRSSPTRDGASSAVRSRPAILKVQDRRDERVLPAAIVASGVQLLRRRRPLQFHRAAWRSSSSTSDKPVQGTRVGASDQSTTRSSPPIARRRASHPGIANFTTRSNPPTRWRSSTPKFAAETANLPEARLHGTSCRPTGRGSPLHVDIPSTTRRRSADVRFVARDGAGSL